MEYSDLLGYLLAALWLLGPVLRRRQQRSRPDTAPAPLKPRISPTQLIRRAAGELERLEGDAVRVRAGFEPLLAARIGPWVDAELLPRLSRRRERLAQLGDGGALAEVIAELSALDSELVAERETLSSLKRLAERRADPALSAVHAAADRLADEVYQPLARYAADHGVQLALGPPLPVVWLAQGDESLAQAPFAPQLLPLPRAVALQPWQWPALGQSLGRYVLLAVPELRGEVLQALGLDAHDEPLAPDSPALARLLFGAWSEALLADFLGAQLFGPAYLQMLVRSQSREDPRAVTAIALDRSGAIQPWPPAHARVRLVGQWLSEMGQESSSLVQGWNAAHDEPRSLHFRGGGGGLAPLATEPLLTQLDSIARRADALSLASLGRSELSDLPGFDGWSGVSGLAARARRSLAAGEPLAGPARALLAGAALASFEHPEAAGSVAAALRESLSGAALERRRPAARSAARTAAAAPTPAAGGGLSARRLTEALLLGELLLVRRGRVAG